MGPAFDSRLTHCFCSSVWSVLPILCDLIFFAILIKCRFRNAPSNQFQHATGRPPANICAVVTVDKMTGAWRRKASRHDVIPRVPSPRHKHLPRRNGGSARCRGNSRPSKRASIAGGAGSVSAFQVHATREYLKREKTNYVQRHSVLDCRRRFGGPQGRSAEFGCCIRLCQPWKRQEQR